MSEAAPRVVSTAQTESEQKRLEEDLHNRGDGVRELLERACSLLVERRAA